MKIEIKDAQETAFKCDALLMPLCEGQKIDRQVDSALEGLPSRLASTPEFQGKAGQWLVIHTRGALKADRLVLLGLGKQEKANAEALRRAGGTAALRLRDMGIKHAALCTGNLGSLQLRPADFAEGLLLNLYEFTAYKKSDKPQALALLSILNPENSQALARQIKEVEAIAEASDFARDLVNTPARDMTPTALLKAARTLKGVTIKCIEAEEASKLGMNAYLAVAKGSSEAPRFIIATYKGGPAKDAPIVLIGKSITFDSGGLSLKPADSMETMKYDMSGGAAVLGTLKAISALGLKLNVTSILPATENLPSSGSPTKPGDVVRTITGKTIEILNTDAEGRLTLADAIGYAVKHLSPREIIDIATLTGACNIALGGEAMAMMGSDEELMERLAAAGADTYERPWRMPLFEEYLDYIKSDIADLRNITNNRSAGLVTSGVFLREFAADTPWAHLDIAGTAWSDKPRPYKPKGATVIGLRLFINYLLHHA